HPRRDGGRQAGGRPQHHPGVLRHAAPGAHRRRPDQGPLLRPGLGVDARGHAGGVGRYPRRPDAPAAALPGRGRRPPVRRRHHRPPHGDRRRRHRQPGRPGGHGQGPQRGTRLLHPGARHPERRSQGLPRAAGGPRHLWRHHLQLRVDRHARRRGDAECLRWASDMRFREAPPPRNGAPPNGVAEEERAFPQPLSSDATVDVDEEQRATDTDEILDGLDRELVGLVPVKTRIREIAALLLVDRLRQRFGIESTRPTLHMCFTGGPGTGKTTVALRMARLLKGLGYLQKGHLVSVTRDEMVGQYIGHTAPKTKEVLARAMGGVLFIDEAYYLHRPENERDYGQEAIEILLQVMENQRENLVVILAGYKD